MNNQNNLISPSILNTGYDANARIHCASWGIENEYDDDKSSYAYVVRDFDAHVAGNPNFLIVTSAGNDGENNREKTINDPGNAENVLTVGSSQSNDFEITNELLGFKCVSGFSSRGPTLDGRIKPDIVAPGECIIAATGNLVSTGQCDPQSPPPPDSSVGGLQRKKGTSYADAIVAGSAALVR